MTTTTDRLHEEVEYQLRDELATRNWYATVGKSFGWTDLRAEHRARLKLLVSLMRTARNR